MPGRPPRPTARTEEFGHFPTLRPATGTLQTVALSHLSRKCGIGASGWLGQFAYGFPISGKIPLKHMPQYKRPKKSTMRTRHLFSSDESRIRERAAKSGRKNAISLWKEPHETG